MNTDLTTFCDRCGKKFDAAILNPVCLPCAIAWDSIEHQAAWGRPLTARELQAAYTQARRTQHRKRRRCGPRLGHLTVVPA